VSAWDEPDQIVIDTAVKQLQTSLHTRVKAKGGYFEYSLPQLTLINMHNVFMCTWGLLQIAFCFTKVLEVR